MISHAEHLFTYSLPFLCLPLKCLIYVVWDVYRGAWPMGRAQRTIYKSHFSPLPCAVKDWAPAIKLDSKPFVLRRLCLLDANLDNLWEVGILVGKMSPSDYLVGQSVGTLFWLMESMWESPASFGWCHPWAGGPGLLKKASKVILRSKPGSSFLCGLCVSSCLQTPTLSSGLNSLSDRLWS